MTILVVGLSRCRLHFWGHAWLNLGIRIGILLVFLREVNHVWGCTSLEDVDVVGHFQVKFWLIKFLPVHLVLGVVHLSEHLLVGVVLNIKHRLVGLVFTEIVVLIILNVQDDSSVWAEVSYQLDHSEDDDSHEKCCNDGDHDDTCNLLSVLRFFDLHLKDGSLGSILGLNDLSLVCDPLSDFNSCLLDLLLLLLVYNFDVAEWIIVEVV